jgi:peptidoglycan/xylan/chitin deacetylase (PgdA/CDA1 family)
MNKLIFNLYILMRRVIYTVSYYGDTLTGSDTHITVLCYHNTADDGWRFSTPIREFKKQIGYLKNNYSFITANELEKFLRGKIRLKNKSVLLTFDDGYKGLLDVKKYLKEKNIKPVVFVLSDFENANVNEIGTDHGKFLTLPDIKQLKEAGWTIGSHGATHAKLTTLGKLEVEQEILASKKKLEIVLGSRIVLFSFPKGFYNNQIINMVKKAQYSLAFSMDQDLITSNTDKLTIPRVGVDGSHTFAEFKAIMKPTATCFKTAILKIIDNKYFEDVYTFFKIDFF